MNTFSASQVLIAVGIILQDEKAVRWPLFERLRWLNEAVREIATIKPSATADTIQITPVEGTLQTLPDGYHIMLQAIRNIPTTVGAGAAGGRSIMPIARDEIDTLIPNWHDPVVLPFSKDVFYVTDDDNDPSVFYVIPGNTGFGRIEIVASAMPGGLVVPDGQDKEAIATYDPLVVPISLPYQSAVIDYVLYRCYSKEVNIGSAAAKAQAHLALFQQALGIKAATESAINVNAPLQRPAV